LDLRKLDPVTVTGLTCSQNPLNIYDRADEIPLLHNSDSYLRLLKKSLPVHHLYIQENNRYICRKFEALTDEVRSTLCLYFHSAIVTDMAAEALVELDLTKLKPHHTICTIFGPEFVFLNGQCPTILCGHCYVFTLKWYSSLGKWAVTTFGPSTYDLRPIPSNFFRLAQKRLEIAPYIKSCQTGHIINFPTLLRIDPQVAESLGYYQVGSNDKPHIEANWVLFERKWYTQIPPKGGV
jgi:hypothetical protein